MKTLPPVESPTIMEFTLLRFRRDLLAYIANEYPESGDGRLVVRFTTTTEYYDEKRGTLLCDVPTVEKVIKGKKTAAAAVPAITIGNFIWERNRNRFDNGHFYLEKNLRDCEGKLVAGAEKREPTRFLDVGLTMTLFENKPQDLLRLQRLVFQYLDLYPYLFVPQDLSMKDGLPNDCDYCEEVRKWFAEEDLTFPGTFIKQMIPIGQTVFTTEIRANIDNLFTARTDVLLEEVPVPNGRVLMDVQKLQAVDIDIFGVEPQETFEDREDEIHSNLQVGDFKEC